MFLGSGQIKWEKARTDSTYEKAHEVISEQMGIFVMQAWQGGALPLSYTRTKVGSNNHSPVRLRKAFPVAVGLWATRSFAQRRGYKGRRHRYNNNFRSDTTPTLQYSITPLLLCCAPPSKNFAGLQNVEI